MERSEIRESQHEVTLIPDFASLHPGHIDCCAPANSPQRVYAEAWTDQSDAVVGKFVDRLQGGAAFGE
jgi:hypothetical protein